MSIAAYRGKLTNGPLSSDCIPSNGANRLLLHAPPSPLEGALFFGRAVNDLAGVQARAELLAAQKLFEIDIEAAAWPVASGLGQILHNLLR